MSKPKSHGGFKCPNMTVKLARLVRMDICYLKKPFNSELLRIIDYEKPMVDMMVFTYYCKRLYINNFL